MTADWTVVWSFKTKRYIVECALAPEEMDPRECFADEADVEAIRAEQSLWFQARVRILLHGIEIAADYLGSCAYQCVADFLAAHRDPDPMNRNCTIMREARGRNVAICHYFPDMVAQAVGAARYDVAEDVCDHRAGQPNDSP